MKGVGPPSSVKSEDTETGPSGERFPIEDEEGVSGGPRRGRGPSKGLKLNTLTLRGRISRMSRVEIEGLREMEETGKKRRLVGTSRLQHGNSHTRPVDRDSDGPKSFQPPLPTYRTDLKVMTRPS